MKVLDLLTELRRRDVKLRVDGDELRFDAPPGAMTPALRATLSERKGEVVDYLRVLRRRAEPRAIGRVARGEPLPVSFAQRRLWFLQQVLPENTLYTLTGALRLTGRLDERALERSLAELIRRHEVLRTTFTVQDGEPMQVVADGIPTPWSLVDLSDQSQDEALEKAMRSWSRTEFDLERGPLFAARIVRLAPHDHILLLAFHHIVFDGWSIGIFTAELSALYAAFSAGRPSPLADLAIQYADFAVWQREWLKGDVQARQMAYWRTQLAGSIPRLELPTDRARPANETFNGALHGFALSSRTTRRLEQIGQQHGATLFMTLLAVFKLLLFRLTRQSDLIVGSPIAGRSRPEVEPLVGFFVNSLALRTRVTGEMRFHALLERVRETCLGAFEHQDLPLEAIAEDLRPERDGRHTPFYQVMFALQTTASAALTLPELTIVPMALEAGTAKFDLTLALRQQEDALGGVLEYNTDLFDRASAERIARLFCLAADAVADDSNVRLDAVPMTTPAERTALVAGGTGVSRAIEDASIGERFRAEVASHPETVAVEDGATRWSYATLADEAERVATALRAAGVTRGSTVGVCLERGARMVAALVGVVLADAAYVPIEPGQPSDRAAGMLRDAGVRWLVTTETLADRMPPGAWRVLVVEQMTHGVETAAPLLASLDDPAYVMFTSGSTGRPKGVTVPQRGIVRLVSMPDYVELGPASIVGHAATPAFDAATFEIWGALLNGGRLVVIPSAVVVSPTALGAYLRRSGVTTLFLTTALVHQIGREAPDTLAGLETLLFGGEAVEPRWVATIQAAGGPARLLHVYGPTENTTFSTWYPIEAISADAPTIPIGGPIAESSAYVLDGGGAIVPAGIAGELFVGGAGLADGYIGSARATAERFVPDDVSGARGGRLYRTGDRVRWARPGVLEFLGRSDNQVKIRGYRIELGEVEAALTALPGVAGAIVIADETSVGKRLVAYVTPAAMGTIDGRTLRDQAKAALPGYMVPAVIAVVPSLPLNRNGKVDRRALPPLETLADAGEAQGTAPVSALERTIAAVWRDVLAVESVGIDDSFFDLGGHSLLLVRVQAGLEAALSRKVALVDLFQFPTVAALAAHLSGASADAGSAPITVSRPASLDEPIAIVGLAGRFPDAPDISTFWENICAGRESIRAFTVEELRAAGVPDAVLQHPRYVRARGVLDDVDLFDAALFGVTPREAALLDPQQRLLLECAWEALEHAGYAPGRAPGRIGVYAGTSANTYLSGADRTALVEAGPLPVLLASDRDFLATRISYKLNLRGPALTVQTACSTSLVAVHTACRALATGECDMAIAGGVSITVPIGGYVYFPDGVASPDGHCRAFDASAAGTVPGNGVGLVVLKRLSAAVADGDTIHAVIRGSAINNDGAGKVGFTAPGVEGQAAVIRAAHAAAGVEPSTITCIEAHGTGTSLGDPIEMTALTQVWGADAPAGTCAIGSVKTNIGHLDAAAGIAGLIKTVLALEHRTVPPSLHFERPNPQVAFGPFWVPTTAQPWAATDGVPRRAGVSSFGMGGTNAHVILEEAPPRDAAASTDGWHVVPVSGHTEAAAKAAAEHLAAALEARQDISIADAAWTQQVGRAAHAVRTAAAGRDADEIAAALRAVVPVSTSGERRSCIWLFPGQGAQALGMGRGLDKPGSAFRAEMDACAAVVDELTGVDLRSVIHPAEADEAAAAMRLADTMWTQVALVAVELAIAAEWRRWGLEPAAVIGHSVGEIAAACVAGVITREAAIGLAAVRGRAMGAQPEGGMLAIAAPAASVGAHLGDGVWLAAVNSAMQTVVSGTEAALARLSGELTAAGIAHQRLAAAGAFHSGLMEGAAPPIEAHAASIALSVPRVPWISTVSGRVLSADEAIDPAYWGRQVTAPVEWCAALATARAMAGGPVVWLEVGPGRTLTGLSRAGALAAETPITSLDQGDAAERFARALGELWSAGVEVDWQSGQQGSDRRRVVLPTYPFQRQRYWLPQASAAPAPRTLLSKKADLDTWFYRPSWKQAAPLARVAVRELAKRRWLLFADAAGFARGLGARLAHAHEEVVLVEAGERFEQSAGVYTIRPDEPSDYDALLAALEQDGDVPTDIVHVWGVTQAAEAPADDRANEVLDRGFFSLLHLAQALSRETFGSPLTLTVVTNGVHAVTGSERLVPEKAAAIGPVRVIPSELPQVSTRAIDIEWAGQGALPDAAIDLVLAELRSSPAGIVAHRGRCRWVPAIEPFESDARDGAMPLRENGVYLVTGGLGAIGLALAEELAVGGARIVLVSRTGLPPRDTWGRVLDERPNDRVSQAILCVRAIEARGAEVWVARGDVSSAADITAIVAETRARFGPVRGVIHAAGLPGSGTILRKRRDEAAAVLAPKVGGTRVLAAALSDEPLDFFVLCSSLTSLLGGPGQVDYCGANAVLDAFAHEAWCRGGARVISLAWDTWRDGGMAADAAVPADLERRKQEVLDAAMSAAEGREVFRRALAYGLPHVAVCTKHLEALASAMRDQRASEAPSAPRPTALPAHPRPPIATPFVAPDGEIDRAVCAAFERALGLERVGVRDSFFDLGGHSLLAMEVMAALNQQFGTSLPVAALYEGLTPGLLARTLEQQLDGRNEPAEMVGRGRRREKPRRSAAARRRDQGNERSHRP